MGMKLFFQISKEFFDSIHSPYIDDYEDEPDFLPDEENELITYKELLELDNDTEELCDCNLCYIIRQLMLFINPRIFKFKPKVI